MILISKSSHHHHSEWKLADNYAADFQKMKDNDPCKIVYGNNNNVGYVIVYLLLYDFLRASTVSIVCSGDSTPVDYIVR